MAVAVHYCHLYSNFLVQAVTGQWGVKSGYGFLETQEDAPEIILLTSRDARTQTGVFGYTPLRQLKTFKGRIFGFPTRTQPEENYFAFNDLPASLVLSFLKHYLGDLSRGLSHKSLCPSDHRDAYPASPSDPLAVREVAIIKSPSISSSLNLVPISVKDEFQAHEDRRGAVLVMHQSLQKYISQGNTACVIPEQNELRDKYLVHEPVYCLGPWLTPSVAFEDRGALLWGTAVSIFVWFYGHICNILHSILSSVWQYRKDDFPLSLRALLTLLILRNSSIWLCGPPATLTM
ncbi:uncharacterized protein EDB91DRAFT_1337703 [Suillus paluster]|uniref:uncharacterized protein n=1 Tax=Suillus paluster TaxID=48578 RepID=UPI001B8818F2|nr:uncharacterized protein EDB91DRAFT_1337703 [Suillus paluster]KAG1735359.1 hypothetical protein EDB91DRAFT_1337703 [Suillus paluster]